MTPIELSTRRRVTGLTSDEFARLFVSLQREVDGEAAHWSATDVESWELVGPPVTAELWCCVIGRKGCDGGAS